MKTQTVSFISIPPLHRSPNRYPAEDFYRNDYPDEESSEEISDEGTFMRILR